MSASINVYLDDLRDCPEGFVLVKTIDELKTLMKENSIAILSMDHDLGIDVHGELLETGYDFVKWFCEHGHFVEKIYLHTDNTVGRDNMFAVLKASQKRGFISKDIEVHPYPLVPNRYSGESNGRNLFIISDIHGMYKQLNELLHYWNRADMLVILGDLVDRGLQSREVLQRILALKKAFPEQVLVCQGNHDEMLLEFLKTPSDSYQLYRQMGGEPTIQSFLDGLSLTEKPYSPFEKASVIQLHYAEEIQLLKDAQSYAEIGKVLLTHAGFDSSSPDYRQTYNNDFLWMRDHYLKPNLTPFVNVFGHTPVTLIHKSNDVWVSEDKRYIGIDGGAFLTGQLNAVLLSEKGELLETYKVQGERSYWK